MVEVAVKVVKVVVNSVPEPPFPPLSENDGCGLTVTVTTFGIVTVCGEPEVLQASRILRISVTATAEAGKSRRPRPGSLLQVSC